MKLTYNVYHPQDLARGIVQIMHGMEEHKGAYDEFAQYLCEHGFVVVTYDHRGHGNRSDEGLGYIAEENGWNLLVEDAYKVSQKIKKEYPPATPFFLFGHSMGSIVARSYLKRYDSQLDGLLLCGAPTKESAASIGRFLAGQIVKKQGGKNKSPLLKKLTTGKFNKKIKNAKTEFDWISYNEKNVQRYIADEKCGFGFTNQGYYDLLCGLCDIFEEKNWVMENPNLPILFLAGEDDPVTGGINGRKKSWIQLKTVGYRKIQEVIYPKMRHAIINEENCRDIFADVVHWINDVLDKNEKAQVSNFKYTQKRNVE
ncbi:MAG: alpha/beta fold hydrolase [Anaerorhabdus sp.]